MKIWFVMLVLFLSVAGLCLFDGIYTTKVFNKLEKESEYIYKTLLTEDVGNENIKTKIENLNEYWTKKMDILCVSISRKDLQPVSDYLQYLYTSTINNSQDEAITYSRLLHYNIEGLRENIGINAINLL
ncbi:MAG: DUF4363 family protein [Clostridiales bacterium]|nr:DUF4363 family protein [Clostridiales bacterium]